MSLAFRNHGVNCAVPGSSFFNVQHKLCLYKSSVSDLISDLCLLVAPRDLPTSTHSFLPDGISPPLLLRVA